MKIIILVFALLIVMSCDSDNGTTKRNRCNSDARSGENGLPPELCIIVLTATSSVARRDPKQGQLIFDYSLIMCLNYAYEMTKCEKKSNLFPP